MLALKEHYGSAECTLDFKNGWQLLFSAILAAQCTDERVNKVTAVMYEEWPRLEDYAAASQEEIEEKVKSCGLYRNKAKNIKASAEDLLARFEGEVPREMDELLSLPGVGRKIANLMLGDYFGVPGVVVDTHCKRITRLLGLSKEENPAKIEKDIEKVLAPEHWIDWGHFLVRHGREICQARCRKCLICPLRERDLCKYAKTKAKTLAKLEEEGDLDACC